MSVIARGNVGRIAERIAMNELEMRGYRVTDLNKEGLSANADFLAAKGGQLFQVQVKGATNDPKTDWWVQYGYCDDSVIDKMTPMYNRKDAFYRASVVVLVAVRSLQEYRCVVLPVKLAEKVGQINLDRGYRTARIADGGRKKPGKVWVHLERRPANPRGEAKNAAARVKLLIKEQKAIAPYIDNWDKAFN